MEWLNELFANIEDPTLVGFSGGGMAAVLLYIGYTIRRMIVRTFVTVGVTGIGLFTSLHWLGFEIQPMDNLTPAQIERQEALSDWQKTLLEFFMSGGSIEEDTSE